MFVLRNVPGNVFKKVATERERDRLIEEGYIDVDAEKAAEAAAKAEEEARKKAEAEAKAAAKAEKEARKKAEEEAKAAKEAEANKAGDAE